MSAEKVVINVSPLILLCKGGLENLLPQLFSTIVVPEAVWDEVSRGGDIASQKIYNYESTWLNRVSIKMREEIMAWNLGDGESEVLSWAYNNKDFAAMIDDRAARRSAQTFGINTLGTGGFLVLAKQKGLIPNVETELKRLQDAGLWLSDEIISLILKQAGETI